MSAETRTPLNRKTLQKWLPLVGLGCGILLLVLGNASPSLEKKTDESYTVQYYTETLEKRIETLCTRVDGVEEASVLLTLERSREYVYAQNSSAAGQTLEYVLVSGGSGEDAILLTEICPQVRGVAVVCTGGDLPAVQQTIIRLLSASLGISSNRIHVAGSGGITVKSGA